MNRNELAARTAEIYVDPYPGRKGSDRVVEACGYCAGTGIYQGKSGLKIYTATVGGSDKGCFKCWGTGKVSFLVSSARATARRQAKAQAEREAEAAKWEAERDALQAAQAPLREALAKMTETVPERAIPAELYAAAYEARHNGIVWSAEDAASILANVERLLAERAALGAVPVTDKRIEVEGEVLATKYQEGMYPGQGSLKMLLQCEGFKLWGSVPSGIQVERGTRVAFMAAVEPSQDDPAFGFYKRPTKARNL
ncbi:hypothetical protein SEA_EMOTION_55 [Arthrobacter phage Emotion]|uniref:Uncharacterized protein n=1 Tax=Arthrobacter phage Emotion TaxID=3038361 RepID=A0AA49ET31_9CAUD|nr:hypothetical protein SEA_EMOTION_55 [Arthrobacter phage Emotion]